MSKRMIDTGLWNNEDIIENFTAEDKYFWLYLLTNPHNNICGIFKNTPALIARDTGLHKDTIVNLLYRFENVHKLISADKGTNEVIILNWYKFNWTKSPKIMALIEKELCNIKSVYIKSLLEERISNIFSDKDTVSIGYRYLPNTNSNNISNINNNIDNNIIDIDKINEYFDKTYLLYPRKVSKIQAKNTYEHKLRGLTKEEAKDKANKIYIRLKRQIECWSKENDYDGRKIEHIPYFSSWLNSEIEDSAKFKRGKK